MGADPLKPRRGARARGRRLLGIDRSGPPPPETLAGRPLHPWTIPNAIGFARAALIPIFLVAAFSTRDGVAAAPAVLFALIALGDYIDGLAARLTGQYSRLGALLDPIVDRALVLAGVAVAWHFELLPRWALAVLVVRELATLVLGRLALARGMELRINWPGRLSVWPLMTALFGALIGVRGPAEALLYAGLGLSLLATALYVRAGLAHARTIPPTPSS